MSPEDYTVVREIVIKESAHVLKVAVTATILAQRVAKVGALLPIKDAARILELSENDVRAAIKAGTLIASANGKQVLGESAIMFGMRRMEAQR